MKGTMTKTTEQGTTQQDAQPRPYIVLEGTTLRDLVAIVCPELPSGPLEMIPTVPVYVPLGERTGRNGPHVARTIFDERFGENEAGELALVLIAAKMWSEIAVRANLKRNVTVG